MKPVSQVHFRVIDKGLFLPVALRLARQAGRVSYWSPDEDAFKSVRKCIGDGFEEIERAPSIFHDKESVDCFVFPDIGFADEQAELISQGFPVWGHRGGDILEVHRGEFLKTLEKTGLPVAPHVVITGITKLKEHLHDKEDLWIKISRFRGDFETFHWRSWGEDENRLNSYSIRFGPFRERIVFYVFDAIDTDIEDGFDTYCIDGQFPKFVLHGMEAKDKAYLCAWQKYSDLPEEVRCVSEAFAPILARFDYRSFFSAEVRITKAGESFFIDPTCRAGSPPFQVMTELIGNYAEVIWQGAHGILVEPEPTAKFGVQALLSPKPDPNEWESLKVDDELERWVKCGNCVKEGDHLWFPPEPEPTSCGVGWLVGIGDRFDEPIRHLKHNVNLLPEGVTCEFSTVAELISEVQKAEAAGMEFTDEPVPEPSIVLEEK